MALYAVVALLVAGVVCQCCEGSSEGGGEGSYTNVWAVGVHGGREDADRVARKHGFQNHGQVGGLANIYKFVLNQEVTTEMGRMTNALKADKHVGLVEQQRLHVMHKRSYTIPTDPQWNDQWFLLNTGQTGLAGRDLNVEPAWIQGITGCGSVVAIVDDGVQYSHPDLDGNFDLSLGYDYFSGDPDPEPSFFDSHGTSVAGEIGMEKSNGNCGVGIAYLSTITGIRLIAGSISDMQQAESLSHLRETIEIYSNSWGPSDDGDFVSGPGNLLQMAFEQGVALGRDGKGSIFVWAAGNGGANDDDCNADGLAGSIYTVSVGSASDDGTQPFYDENCSSKLVVAFVSGTEGISVATTQRTNLGPCRTDFDGTSAACPVASGAIALALEAKVTSPSWVPEACKSPLLSVSASVIPVEYSGFSQFCIPHSRDLTWRDVQYLIVYTANPDILSGGNFITNGDGLRVSHSFGFGALDAEALVTRAKRWVLVPDQLEDLVTVSPTSGTATSSSPLVITFTYSGSIDFLEHVVVRATISTSSARGDIRVELTSPSGTQSVLMDYRDLDSFSGSYNDWPFMSVHYWGESPQGQWTLSILFRGSTGSAAVSGVSATLYGTDVTPQAVQNIPSLCDVACARGCSGPGPSNCDACVNLRDAVTLDCIDTCPAGYAERNGYCYDASLPEPTCEPSDELSVGFDSDMYTVAESGPYGGGSVLVCVVSESQVVGQLFTFTVYSLSGTAQAGDDYVAVFLTVTFVSSPFVFCFNISILPDTVVEDDEVFTVNLISSDPSVTVFRASADVVIIDDDNPDLSLRFVGDTPTVEENSVFARFTMGSDIVSVECDVETKNAVDCSNGEILFENLPPRRARLYNLIITGTGSNGETNVISRDFRTNTIPNCWAHLINDGVTVSGDQVTVEFEGTGPEPPTVFTCRHRRDSESFSDQVDCTSPYTISGLDPGSYELQIRPVGECRRRQRRKVNFDISV